MGTRCRRRDSSDRRSCLSGSASILWFRRDLRLSDHPALAKAARRGPVLPLFVLDPCLMGPAGIPRQVFLLRTLADLDRRLRALGTELVLRSGRPEDVVPQVAREVGANEVHISADFGPYGAARDRRVAGALGEVSLVATGSPYAVSPPRLLSSAGRTYRVFTPFKRAWLAHGWPGPADSDAEAAEWMTTENVARPDEPELSSDTTLPEAGEAAALAAWSRFRAEGLKGYGADRDRPDLDRTSRLSPHLHFGTIHPRTMLADLTADDDRFITELAWREFYAAVLWDRPESARQNYDARMDDLPIDTGPDSDELFEAWCTGRTGYPIIDAGMRQLRAEAWMHNRVRMLVASFLVKDLHLDWRRGARYFMRALVDGDIASNQHGWQWAAGTGTDASPYFRIFNPVTQSKRVDPHGEYIRRWVPALRTVPDRYVHEPWLSPTPVPYVPPIVDHDVERQRSLDAFTALRRSSTRSV